MPNHKKIEKLIEKALNQFGSDEEMLQLLDPCTKLRVNISIVRGQLAVRRQVSHNIKRQFGAYLADETPLSQEDWKTLLSLPAFSKKSAHRSGRKMRELLLEFKHKGLIRHGDLDTVTTNRINEVFERERMPYRVTSFKPEGDYYHFRLTKII